MLRRLCEGCRGLFLLCLVCLLLAGCLKKPKPPAYWPRLPKTKAAAQELVASKSQRDTKVPELPVLALPMVLKHLASKPTQWKVGWSAILRWLAAQQRRASKSHYLLLGGTHDTGGQLKALKRLLVPGGLHLTLAATELFAADGRWFALSLRQQDGDDALISALQTKERRRAWKALLSRQQRHNYTAWKYGYIEQVMGLLPLGLGSGVPLFGCDMSAALQQRLSALGKWRFHLRDLHCYLSLQDRLKALPGPHRVAMFWGRDHLKASSFRRFLSKEVGVTSVLLIGHRQNPLHLEAKLRQHLVLFAPLLLPLDQKGQQALLFLPDRWTAGVVERSRVRSNRGGTPRVLIGSDESAKAICWSQKTQASKQITIPAFKPQTFPSRVQQACRVQVGKKWMIGLIPTWRGRRVLIEASWKKRLWLVSME